MIDRGNLLLQLGDARAVNDAHAQVRFGGEVDVQTDFGNGELGLAAVNDGEDDEAAVGVWRVKGAQQRRAEQVGAGEPSAADDQDDGGAVARFPGGQHVHGEGSTVTAAVDD